jgi:hypothetical protein
MLKSYKNYRAGCLNIIVILFSQLVYEAAKSQLLCAEGLEGFLTLNAC